MDYREPQSRGALGLLTIDIEPVPLPQGESMKRELLELRTKLSKQENLLQSTAERLRTANQQKESMEQFIFSQCGCPQDREWERTWGGFPDSPCAVNGQ